MKLHKSLILIGTASIVAFGAMAASPAQADDPAGYRPDRDNVRNERQYPGVYRVEENRSSQQRAYENRHRRQNRREYEMRYSQEARREHEIRLRQQRQAEEIRRERELRAQQEYRRYDR